MKSSTLENENMKNALMYRRVSTKQQTEGVSPETQRDVIEKYATENNYKIVQDFYDDGYSAKTANREKLQEMLEYCVKNKGTIDAILVYKIDRLSRNTVDYLDKIKGFLAAQGIRIISVTEPFEESATGKLVEHMMIGLAEFDNNLKSERVTSNMEKLAMDGYWQHKAPRGYDCYRIPDALNPKAEGSPSLVPNEEAHLIRRILNRFSKGESTQAQIAQYAYELGVRTDSGKKLSYSSIGNMLRQPAYAGLISGKLTHYALVEAKHEGLIRPSTYSKIQSLLTQEDTQLSITKSNPSYPLKSVLLHSQCSKPVYASAPRTGGGKSYSPRYQCNRCRGSGSIKSDKAHSMFEELLEGVSPMKAL